MKRYLVILLLVFALTGCKDESLEDDDNLIKDDDQVILVPPTVQAASFISDVSVSPEIEEFILSIDNPNIMYYEQNLVIVADGPIIYKVETGEETISFTSDYITNNASHLVNKTNSYDKESDTLTYGGSSVYELNFTTLQEERITGLYMVENTFDGGGVILEGEPKIFLDDGSVIEFEYFRIAHDIKKNNEYHYIIYNDLNGAKCDARALIDGDTIATHTFNTFCGEEVASAYDFVLFLEIFEGSFYLNYMSIQGVFLSLDLSEYNITGIRYFEDYFKVDYLENSQSKSKLYEMNFNEVDISGTDLRDDELIGLSNDFIIGFDQSDILSIFDRVTKEEIMVLDNHCPINFTSADFFNDGYSISSSCEGVNHGMDVYNLNHEQVFDDNTSMTIFLDSLGYYIEENNYDDYNIYTFDYITYTATKLEGYNFTLDRSILSYENLIFTIETEDSQNSHFISSYVVFDLEFNYIDTYNRLNTQGFNVFTNDEGEMIFSEFDFEQEMVVDLYN